MIETLEIKLNVVQGDQLVAKDRNLMGAWTTSDPYVIVSIYPRGLEDAEGAPDCIKLGKSETIRYCLSPKWEFETSVELPLEDVSDDCQFEVKIVDWDEDAFDEEAVDNLMGIVPVNVTPTMYRNSPRNTRTRWYGVPASSADRASGRIQCTIDVTKRRKPRSEIPPPVYRKPSGVPITNQATYTPTEAEIAFNNQLREAETQGGGSVMTDMKVSMLSLRGSVQGASENVKQSTLGKLATGAAETVTATATGSINVMGQVAMGSVNGVKQVAVGSTNMAIGGVTGVAQVASYGAVQVATGSMNAAAQVATGSMNVAAQGLKATAGVVTAPLNIFTASKRSSDANNNLQRKSGGAGGMMRSLSSRNLFSSMTFTAKASGPEENGRELKRSSSSSSLFSSMSSSISGRSERRTALGDTRSATASRNKSSTKAAETKPQQNKPEAPRDKPPKQPVAPSAKEEKEKLKPPKQPVDPSSAKEEKEKLKLDMDAVGDAAAKSDRPKPVRQRSAPRIRKSNGTKKAKPMEGGEWPDDINNNNNNSEEASPSDSEKSKRKSETKKNKQKSETKKGKIKTSRSSDSEQRKSDKKKKDKKKTIRKSKSEVANLSSSSSLGGMQDSASSLSSRSSVKSRSSKVKKSSSSNINKKKNENSLLGPFERQDTDDSILKPAVPEIGDAKLGYQIGKPLSTEHNNQEGRRSSMELNKPERSASMGHTMKRFSMEHARQEGRKDHGQPGRSASVGHNQKPPGMDNINMDSSTAETINPREVAAMRRSIVEKDTQLLILQRELDELRRSAQKRGSMGHESAYSASMSYSSDRYGSVGSMQSLEDASSRRGSTSFSGAETSENSLTEAQTPFQQSANHTAIAAPPKQEDEAGFYVDAEGTTYYLDANGIEYYQDPKDGGWYADFVPNGQQTNENTTGWYVDVDGGNYYVDQFGIEYFPNPKDGEYYDVRGRRLYLGDAPKEKPLGNDMVTARLGA
ncbi:expressed unknown protein [Seminavis robusta]|uniref:C2 domain-containing protein n=1 Tax=Seminavis robusta TaxID=568900 RepID=A0A9N8E930_9STRA|nr:expressed unknown protein [Seminavis robusta]|eukprot:Sro643_g180390.1 n/a (976) ;mRNA; f:44141-47068